MGKSILAVVLAPVVLTAGLFAYATNVAKAKREEVASQMARVQTAGLLAAAAAADASAAASAQQPRMVRPESLPQGFVLVVKDLAGLAKENSPIYLASSHNGWDPGDANQRLTPRSDGRWQIELPKPKTDAPLAFKFTRGNWDRCEVSTELADIDNRGLPEIDAAKLAEGEKPIFEFEVPKWADQRPTSAMRPDLDPYYDLAVTGDVRRLQVAGGGVPTQRDVLVWLPPGYDDPANAARTYPILYLHDAQNVFQQMPGVPGEWGADEIATRLIAEGVIEPIIIAAVPHAGRARRVEYLPYAAYDLTEVRGQQYARFIATEVVPRVERSFRVRPGKEHRVIGGASLGAVISLYIATEYPDLFDKVLLESTPLIANDQAGMKFFAARDGWPTSIYFAMSGMEAGADQPERNKEYVASVDTFRVLTEAKLRGRSGVNTRFLVDPGTEHNELAWNKRLPGALEFFFSAKK